MMAVLAAALVLGQTPTTADEAYVRAGKIAQDLKLEDHLDFLDELVRFQTGSEKSPPEPFGKFIATTKPNVVRRRIAEIVDKVSPWVVAGNRLPLMAESETGSPYSTLRRGYLDAMHYRFANGDPKLGVDLWRQITELIAKYEVSKQDLTPASSRDIDESLFSMMSFVDGLSASSLQLVESHANRLLLANDFPALRYERLFNQFEGYLKIAFEEAQGYLASAPIGVYAAKVPEKFRPAVERAIYDEARMRTNARILAMGKTEADWYRLSPTTRDPDKSAFMTMPVETEEQFIDAYLDLALPDYLGWNTKRLGRRQSYVRQLILRCKVLRYRWENDKLPSDLTDVVPVSETVDPFSERRFEYEQKWNGFRIWSYWRGTDDILELQAPRN